ncbi:MAG: 7-carboxy-7-deazaguanine synthase QueE [Kiritimatiellales bacterium]|nr:7-carboxy-7-deazaguanine synthase QueE [Kiritimatiellales bacterium]
MKAWLSEIFSSIQGEGPYVGERHLFLRFCGCHRDCFYCDTPVEQTETVSVEKVPGSGTFEQLPNPLSVDELAGLIGAFSGHRRISITGGEPLLQSDFLRELFPRLESSIYLETSGDHPEQLQALIEWIDVVAMDVKLPSVGKQQENFSSHWKFLKICRERGAEVFVKTVLSAETDDDEFFSAVEGIREAGGPETLLVLQPMSAAEKTAAVPSVGQLLKWQETACKLLSDVRIIPQCHKTMEML